VAAIAVTDAHALIWYGLGRHRKLGRRAKALFERAEAERAAIYVPTIALVEVGEATWSGAIALQGGFSAWAHALFSSGHFFSVDLTREIVERAQTLYAIPERGDRLIAATAAYLQCPLITRDATVAAVAGIDVVW